MTSAFARWLGSEPDVVRRRAEAYAIAGIGLLAAGIPLADPESMDPDVLRRLPWFRFAAAADVAALAARARLLRLPAGRRVRAPAGPVGLELYLVRGQVRRFHRNGSAQTVDHRSPAARAPILNGDVPHLVTQSRVRLLRIDGGDAVEAAPALPARGDVLAPGDEGFDPWLERFLGGPLLERLSAAQLERLFRGLRRHEVEAGEIVLRRGAAGDDFYVVRAGVFRVVRDGRCCHVVERGGFFGEDALLRGAPRNADVVAATRGLLMALPASEFAELLGRTGAPIDVGQCRRLELARGFDPRVAAESLPRGAPYLLTGGSAAERRFATFLLRHRGIEAYAEV